MTSIDYTGTIVTDSDGKPFRIVRRVDARGRPSLDTAWIAEATNPKFPATITITGEEIGVRREFQIATPNEALRAIVRPVIEVARNHGRAYAKTERGNVVSVLFDRGEETFTLLSARGDAMVVTGDPEAIVRRLSTWGAIPW